MNNIFPETTSHVAVISPAGSADRTRLEAGVALLRSWGLKVTVMPHVFSGARESYLSASADERL
ncbi:MAG: LD-carboxypeptidase, partial [Lentisphaerota bacterium]